MSVEYDAGSCPNAYAGGSIRNTVWTGSVPTVLKGGGMQKRITVAWLMLLASVFLLVSCGDPNGAEREGELRRKVVSVLAEERKKEADAIKAEVFEMYEQWGIVYDKTPRSLAELLVPGAEFLAESVSGGEKFESDKSMRELCRLLVTSNTEIRGRDTNDDDATRRTIRQVIARNRQEEIDAFKPRLFESYNKHGDAYEKNPQSWHELFKPLILDALSVGSIGSGSDARKTGRDGDRPRETQASNDTGSARGNVADDKLVAAIETILGEIRHEEIEALKPELLRDYRNMGVSHNEHPQTWHQLLEPMIELMCGSLR